MPKYIVLLGPPGAGKGTQARIVSEKMGLQHISSGEIFRENINKQTELGKLAKDYLDRGELVPDDVTIAMIRERLSHPDCASGALLDGFPRTSAQAKELGVLLVSFQGKVNVVLFIDVPEAIMIERLGGRWTCRKDESHIYHEKFNPPQIAGVCDLDGAELYQREDQKVEAVIRRIQIYSEQTAPLIEYYRQAGSLIVVDGSRPIEQVTVDLLAALAGLK